MRSKNRQLGCQLTWQPNMPDSSFDVTRFENRNGVVSWRASGWLHGLRVRKNFKSREEAGAELAALEAKAAQAAGNVRGTSTFLADDQLREAEVRRSMFGVFTQVQPSASPKCRDASSAMMNRTLGRTAVAAAAGRAKRGVRISAVIAIWREEE